MSPVLSRSYLMKLRGPKTWIHWKNNKNRMDGSNLKYVALDDLNLLIVTRCDLIFCHTLNKMQFTQQSFQKINLFSENVAIQIYFLSAHQFEFKETKSFSGVPCHSTCGHARMTATQEDTVQMFSRVP